MFQNIERDCAGVREVGANTEQFIFRFLDLFTLEKREPIIVHAEEVGQFITVIPVEHVFKKP